MIIRVECKYLCVELFNIRLLNNAFVSRSMVGLITLQAS